MPKILMKFQWGHPKRWRQMQLACFRYSASFSGLRVSDALPPKSCVHPLAE